MCVHWSPADSSHKILGSVFVKNKTDRAYSLVAYIASLLPPPTHTCTCPPMHLPPLSLSLSLSLSFSFSLSLFQFLCPTSSSPGLSFFLYYLRGSLPMNSLIFVLANINAIIQSLVTIKCTCSCKQHNFLVDHH